MAITILNNLIPQLEKAKQLDLLKNIENQLDLLSKSMKLYVDTVDKAFIQDLGNHSFSKRMYFNRKAYGEENMFLEPQGGYMLQINDLSIKKKKNLYKETRNRVFENEEIAARQQQISVYWSSYWSQADNWESYLMPSEGLPNQTTNYGDIPVYCAHAHAWPLYCYFRLKE